MHIKEYHYYSLQHRLRIGMCNNVAGFAALPLFNNVFSGRNGGGVAARQIF